MFSLRRLRMDIQYLEGPLPESRVGIACSERAGEDTPSGAPIFFEAYRPVPYQVVGTRSL